MKTLSQTIFLISGFILLITGSIFFMLKAPAFIWILMMSTGFVLMMSSSRGKETSHQGSGSEIG